MPAAALVAARAVAVLDTAATTARASRLAGPDADAGAQAVGALMAERLLEDEPAGCAIAATYRPRHGRRNVVDVLDHGAISCRLAIPGREDVRPRRRAARRTPRRGRAGPARNRLHTTGHA